MQLKHRLSLISILIFSIVFISASAVIFFSFRHWMKNNTLSRLESKTLLAAVYYLEKDEISYNEHESIKDQLRKNISRKDIAVYNNSNLFVSGEMFDNHELTNEFIDLIRDKQDAYLVTQGYFYYGIFYKDNQGDFIIITREDKSIYNDQLASLLKILSLVCLFGILIIYFFSRMLGNIAYKPITNIISQIRRRDTQTFGHPLTLPDSYTEINDLVDTYNLFVDRLAQTFVVQKNFIDYVSHELRTPITALLGTLEVSKQKERSLEETNDLLHKLKQYTLDLETTLDNMMILSGANTNFELTDFRVDEVLWEVIENAMQRHNAIIRVDFQVEDSQILQCKGNASLITLAINNLIENAIKYSSNQEIKTVIYEDETRLCIAIIDKGIGIPESDLSQITRNFYRGSNTEGFQGKGIGLSMAKIIFDIHEITLKIDSSKDGTKMTLIF